jgi:hypothetical protein
MISDWVVAVPIPISWAETSTVAWPTLFRVIRSGATTASHKPHMPPNEVPMTGAQLEFKRVEQRRGLHNCMLAQ